MTLSKRALDFLQKSRRELLISTEEDIRNAFLANHAPIFEPLIEFQLNFGGYIFYAGLAPIKFSLLKGDGGYPRMTNTSMIEFEESNLPMPRYYFDCATTNYQMQFFLDERGIYYEDYEAKASNFEKVVEHLALWKEMQEKGSFEEIYRERKLKPNNVDKLLELKLLPEASDQYTLWFANEYIYMKQWQGLSTLIVSNDYQEKDKLILL